MNLSTLIATVVGVFIGEGIVAAVKAIAARRRADQLAGDAEHAVALYGDIAKRKPL